MALLISILLFAGFIYLVNVELFDYVEAHYYNPSVINSYVRENAEDARIVQTHINNLKSKFYTTLTVPAIRSSFLYNQKPEDIFERSRIYGILIESTSGLQSVQFVDSNGIRLHYSTSPRDIMTQNQTSTAYRNYNENPTSLPYEIVSVEDVSNVKLTMDDQNDRIIFSFPFRDSMDVFRGTALFSVSIRTFAERLIETGRLKTSDNISIIDDPSGILLGSPEMSKSVIFSRVAEIWKKGTQDYITLDAEDSGAVFSLISTKTEQNLFFGRLVNSSLFSISAPMKFVLQVSIFLTFFLAFFFLLNLKPSPVTIVRNRITRLRDSLFEQLYANKSTQERAKWILELEQRRDEIRSQLKSNLKFKKRIEENINGIIDKSWDELLAVLKVGSGQELVVVQQVSKEPAVQVAKGVEKTDAIEEIGEAEALEEIGDVEEVGEAEELEEIGDVEEVGKAEEVSEADEIEEIGEAEELEEIGEAEEVSKAEELSQVEEIEEINEADKTGDIEEIKELGKFEESNELEKQEAFGETEDFNEIDDFGDIGDIEDIEDIEINNETETIDEVEEHAEAKEENVIDKALRIAMEPDESQRGGLFWLASKFARNLNRAHRAKVPLLKKPSAYEGLLKLASKKAAKKAASKGKGLIALAGEHEKPSPVSEKGLLAQASKIEKPASIQGKGLLAQASKIEKSTPDQVKGLLDLTGEIEKPAPSQGKGLLSLASEIEIDTDTDDEEVQNIIEDMAIVSPFSSMFSDLSENE